MFVYFGVRGGKKPSDDFGGPWHQLRGPELREAPGASGGEPGQGIGEAAGRCARFSFFGFPGGGALEGGEGGLLFHIVIRIIIDTC